MTPQQEYQALAAELERYGVSVAIGTNPGNPSVYKFHTLGPDANYFAIPDSKVVGRALGRADAITFARGFLAATRQHLEAHESPDSEPCEFCEGTGYDDGRWCINCSGSGVFTYCRICKQRA